MFSGVFQQLHQAGRARAAHFDAVKQQADFDFQDRRVGRIGAVGGVQLFDQILAPRK